MQLGDIKPNGNISRDTLNTLMFPVPFYLTTTRDISVTGDQAFTGLGFTPSFIILQVVVSGADKFSIGHILKRTSGSNYGSICMYTYSDSSAWGYDTTKCVNIRTDASNYAQAVAKSIDSDGFTITWSKTGSPTGTAYIYVIAFK